MDDLITRIQKEMPSFSKSQKQISQFILDHYDKAAFMTAAKLGKTVGVSESTVVRFATELDFKGYPQLQRALQELIRNKLTSVQRMEVSSDRMGGRDVLQTVLQTDMEMIRFTLDEIDKESFHATVDALLAAKRIYILGIRSSSSLANFLGFYFNLLFDNVTLIQTSGVSEIFEQLLCIDEGDVFLGISFPRYSKRTVSAMRFSKDRGATVVALTDSGISPLVEVSNHALIAKSEMASFVDSLVAPLSVVNALIVALGIKRKEIMEQKFNLLEHIWEEYEVYEKSEDGYS